MKDSNIKYQDCQGALDQLTDLLESGPIDEVQLSQLKLLYPDCISVMDEQLQLWQELSEVSVPQVSPKLHSDFYRSLQAYEAEHSSSQLTPSPKGEESRVVKMWNGPLKWAIAASLFAIGILVGRGWGTSDVQQPLMAEVDDSKTSYFSYASDTRSISASDKIMAIQEIKDESRPNQKIIEALYKALLNDPNINVRITAVETLMHFAEEPRAREYLIRAIPYQESALVQIALADAMFILEEKGSANAWEELLQSENVEPDVKNHISETLEILL